MSDAVHHLTMSSLDLAEKCPYGFSRDAVREDRSGEAARKGTMVHRIVEATLLGYRATWTALTESASSEELRLSESVVRWVEAHGCKTVAIERGLRYFAGEDQASWGPKRGEDGYAADLWDVLPGTEDLIFRGKDGVLEVVDIKTGKKQNAHAEQLFAQSVAISRILGEEHVRCGFLFARLRGCPEPEWIELDSWRLDEEAGRIYRVLKTIRDDPKPKHGDHCWRCSARDWCESRNRP